VLLVDGLAGPSTLPRIVDRIGEPNGVMYIYIEKGYQIQPRTKHVLSGALSHDVAMAGSHVILRVTVVLASGEDKPIVTLVYELHHAVEVLESRAARNEAAVGALFNRIGLHAFSGIVETGCTRTLARSPPGTRRESSSGTYRCPINSSLKRRLS
jgi:hypothetical protein